VISFSDHRVGFRRQALDLGAKINPNGRIQYKVMYGRPGTDKDDQCHIVGGRLKLWRSGVSADQRDIMPPSLPTTCLIEASAPASDGRAAAKPKRALITVGSPTFGVSVDPVPAISWSEHKQVTVRVREESGSAYEMWVGSDSDKCTGGEDPPAGFSAHVTYLYEITVTLADPGTTSYTCAMKAVAGPQDIAGGKNTDEFTITVNP
jgi:hypothetical protein